MTDRAETEPAAGAYPGAAEVRRALIALSAAYFFVGATSLSVIGLLPEMSDALGVDAASIAFLVTIFAIVYAVASPGLQALVGGKTRRILVAAGLALVAASCFVSAVATDYTTVALSRVGMAVGAALTGPTVSAAAAALVPPEKRAAALSAVFTGLTVSTVLGVPLASFLGQTVGWRWAWGAMGVAALAVIPAVLATLSAGNRGDRATLSALFAVMRDRALALAVSTTAMQICAQFVTYALMAAWLVERLGAPSSMVPPTLFLYGLGGVFGNALSSFVVDRLGAERTVQACLAVTAGAMVCLWLLPQWPIVGVALAFVWATGGLMIMAPLQSRLVRLAPERAGLSLALNASAIYVGMSAGSAISGGLYAAMGPGVLPLGSAIVMGLALLVFRASLSR